MTTSTPQEQEKTSYVSAKFCESHLSLLFGDIYIPTQQLSFLPQDIDFNKFQQYPRSQVNPKLLSRHAYLQREENKDDLRLLDALYRAISLFTVQEEFYLSLPKDIGETFLLPYLLPLEDEGGDKILIPAGEKIIILGYPTSYNGDLDEILPNIACLFPGKIVTSEKGNVYTSFKLEEALAALENKSSYSNEMPSLSLGQDETLASLKEKMVSHLRTKIKSWLLSSAHHEIGRTRSKLYCLKNPDDSNLPLEVVVDRIFKGEIGPEESLLLREFPLLFTSLTKEVTLYIDEQKAITFEASKYIESAGKDRYLIINPVLASETATPQYTLAISVEMRALHINYAYQITSSQNEEIYGDFLGDANWILAPMTIFKSNGILRGKVEKLPIFFEEILIPQGDIDVNA